MEFSLPDIFQFFHCQVDRNAKLQVVARDSTATCSAPDDGTRCPSARDERPLNRVRRRLSQKPNNSMCGALAKVFLPQGHAAGRSTDGRGLDPVLHDAHRASATSSARTAFLRSMVSGLRICRFNSEDPFYSELTRRRLPFLTYSFAAVSLGVLIAMMLGPAPLGTADTLVAWGGSFGPRTTDTDRWRVFTSIFVHRGALHAIVNIAVLVQLGLVLERLVGPFTFAVVFLASGALASTVGTASAPMSVYAGSGGAVCGLYGLLLATAMRVCCQATLHKYRYRSSRCSGLRQPSSRCIPSPAVSHRRQRRLGSMPASSGHRSHPLCT